MPGWFRRNTQSQRVWPASPEQLLLATLAALAVTLPERALVLLKRYGKRYGPGKPAVLLTVLALAQQGQATRAWGRAWTLLRRSRAS